MSSVKGQNSERGIETKPRTLDNTAAVSGVKGQNSERGIETAPVSHRRGMLSWGVKGQNSERGIETSSWPIQGEHEQECQRPEFRAWN